MKFPRNKNLKNSGRPELSLNEQTIRMSAITSRKKSNAPVQNNVEFRQARGELKGFVFLDHGY